MRRPRPAPAVSAGAAVEELRRLDAVSRTGLSNAPDETMDRLAALVTRLLGASVGLVSLVDDRRQFFPGQIGLPAPLSDVRETPLLQSICRTVVDENGIVQIDQASTDPRWADHGAHTILGVESYLGAPLIDADGRVLGSLCAIEPTSRAWTADERQILLDLAFSASSELRARISVTDANLARARVETMADVSAALISSMNTDESIVRMLDVIVERFAVWAFVFIAAQNEIPEQIFARHRHGDRHGPTLEVLASDSPQRLQDLAMTRSVLTGAARSVVLDVDDVRGRVERAGASAQLLETLGVGPVIIVPMQLSGEIMGSVTIFGDPEQPPYDSVDLALASDLAHRAAMTFAHGRQYAREKRVASELQHSLLPDLPRLDTATVDAIYLAATQGVDVGGDWYDLIDTGAGSFVATIGDVTGHSIRAAAAMGRLQTAVHIFANAGYEPAEILDRAARASSDLLGDLLATCLVASVAPACDGWRTVTLANAGHLPPLVIEPDGTARLLDVQYDPLLGLRTDAPSTRRTTSHSIATGSTLVFYTDGLIEHRREALDHALQRLVTAASEIGAGAVKGMCHRLVEMLAPDGRDDIACLMIGV